MKLKRVTKFIGGIKMNRKILGITIVMALMLSLTLVSARTLPNDASYKGKTPCELGELNKVSLNFFNPIQLSNDVCYGELPRKPFEANRWTWFRTHIY